MVKHLLKTMVAVLAIAAAAAGPVRGQNASPDVTLDFTTNDWGIPEGKANKAYAAHPYTSGDYTITLQGGGGSSNGYYFNNGFLILGKSGAYLELPEFESAVDSIVVVGNNSASPNVTQNIYVGETAVSTQTTGARGTNTYVINENYRAAGNIYTLKVDNAYNTQITYIKVYYVSSGGGSGSEPPTPGQNSNVSWVLTPYGDLQTGDTVVIVDKDTERAMTNNNGSFSAPSADAIGLSGDQNALSDAPAATLQWVVERDNGNYMFKVPGTSNYLYCTSDNDGVRVGSGNKSFEFQNGGTYNVPFLKNNATSRYLGLTNAYLWRCPSSISNSSIKNNVISFYKKTVVIIPTHTVRFASGNDGWQMQDVTASASATAPAVLQNVMAGDSLVATYSGTRKVKSVKAVKYVDQMTLPLTIEALNNGTITVQFAKSGMKYSVNGGSKESTTSNTNINVSAGDKVSFYGNGTSITNYYGTNIKGSEGFTCKVYGNIMSLIDEENFATATTLANQAFANLFQNNTSLVDASNLMLPATTLDQQCYSGMFYGCSGLTAAPALPATTLKLGCYSLMFYGCRALIAAPALPATTLDQYCYSGMFDGCTALIAAPALPATTLANSCYYQMFYGCSSLTAAPVLPATTLADYCYSSMFDNCTGLTAAPVLPATTLAQQCYGSMFAGDTNLTSVPALPATTLADDCYSSMFDNCTGLTTVPADLLPATTLKSGCYSGMFYGCTGLTAAPVLPATTLANNCYNNMFNGCSMLSSVTCLATNISASYCTDNWLTGVAATGTIITPSSTNWSTGASTEWPYGVSGIPDGWTRVNADE